MTQPGEAGLREREDGGRTHPPGPARFPWPRLTVRGALNGLAFLILAPLVAVQLAGELGHYRAERREALATDLAAARAAAEDLERWIAETVRNVATLGHAVEAGKADRRTLLEGILAERRMVRRITWLDLTEGEAETFGASAAGAGRNHPAVQPVLGGAPWAVREHPIAPGRAGLGVATALGDGVGGPSAVLLVELDPALLAERVLAGPWSAGLAVLVLDGQGRPVHRDPSPPSGLDTVVWHETGLVQAALGGREALGVLRQPGAEARLVAVVPSGGGGAVLVSRRLEDVLGPTRRAALRQAGLGLGVATLAFLAAIHLGGLLTRPLRRLERAAATLGEGGAWTPVAQGGPVEVARLGASLDRMAAGLSARSAALESERRQAQALAADRDRLAQHLGLILESTDEGVYGLDLEGRVTFVNRAACRLLGYAADELVGRDIHALVHGRHPDGRPYPPTECLIHRARALRAPQRVHGEVLWRRDGSPLHVEMASAPMMRDGRLEGVVSTFVDVGARREMEAERERLMAEREAILHTVSHDLRTPLTAVIARAQMLRKMEKETVRIRHLDAIVHAGRRMSGMIQDVLDAASLERNALTLRPEPVRLGELVTELLERFGPALETGRVRLEDPGVPAVQADPERLERVLTNLVSNALKYAPSDTTVVVRFEEEPRSVRVDVRDRGPGIPEEDRAHLFERFQRGHGGARRAGGVGLGLHIARRFVEAMGGEIWAESEPGHGSTFAFRLPKAPPAGRPTHTP